MISTVSTLASSTTPEQSSDDGAQGGAKRLYNEFPIFIVAFTLMWTGALGLVEHLWTASDSRDMLLFADCASIFLLLGAAILLARSRTRTSRIFAIFSMTLSVASTLQSIWTGQTLKGPLSFDMPLNLDGGLGALACLLSLAVFCCTLGRPLRRLARWMAVGIAVCAVAIRFWPSLLQAGLDTPDTANFAMLLVVLSCCAVFSLSKNTRPESAFANRAVAVVGILGTMVAVLAWCTLTDSERHTTRDHAQVTLNYAAENLSRAITGPLDLMEGMAQRWNSLEVMPSANLAQRELSNYLLDNKAVDVAAVLDSDHAIRWIDDHDRSSRRWLNHHLSDAQLSTLISDANKSTTVRIGSVEGQTAIAAPLTATPMKGWSILALYSPVAFASQTLNPDHSRIKIRIDRDHQLVYDGVSPGATSSFISQRVIPSDNGHVWQLSAWHEHPLVPPIETLHPELILLLCLTFTYLLTRSQKLAAVLLAQSEQQHNSALHDPLTGLPNAQYLKAKLHEVCRTATQNSGTVWVVLFNLEGLSLINASMGQNAGDYMMREVARRIENTTSNYGFAARLRGGEFVVVANNSAHNDILNLTSRVLGAIARLYHLEGSEICLTANAGVTASDGRVSDAMELVREASLAVARAKLEGPNTWHEYSDDLSDAVIERLQIRNKLLIALDSDALEIYYQPLINGQTGRIVSAEALLRWEDPELGYISPATSIPVAEDMGIIVHLTDWVLGRICRDIKALRTRNLIDFPLQINISPTHFQRDGFVQSIRSKLAEHSLPPEYLAIEITEGAMMGKNSKTISKLQELKALGIKVAIDDFGTGYSSLSYLKNLPIDKIKIDKSFITDVVTNQHDAALVKTIIGLAHNFNVRVVAEGVETEPQFWFLLRNFCDEFQGYLFARPEPIEELERRLVHDGSRVVLPQADRLANPARTVLLLDDEENILRAMKRTLRHDGYEILTARTPRDAFTLLAENDVQVIVSDQRMPDMTGTEFFNSIKKMYPNTVRLILSGYTDLNSVTNAINYGAIYKFLTKPWDDEEFRTEIARAFRMAGAAA